MNPAVGVPRAGGDGIDELRPERQRVEARAQVGTVEVPDENRGSHAITRCVVATK